MTGDVRADVRAFLNDYKDALSKSDSMEVLSMYGTGAEVTLAGKGKVFRGREAIRKSGEETIFNPDQNVFSIDSLDVFALGPSHALALVVYKLEPPDQDLSRFHTTATYVLEKTRTGWQILHAHVSSDWVAE